jgi:hypothetical protein
MFIFESAGWEFLFYIFALIWFGVMPKRSIAMLVLAFAGTQGKAIIDTASIWLLLMIIMSFTNPRFALAFLIGFGLGSGKIQDRLQRRVL